MSTPHKPNTIIIAQDGSGDYPTIQAALDAAKPGDTVKVLKGTYTGDLNMRQGVNLQGEGKDTRIVAADQNAIIAKNVTDICVSDLFADGAEKENHVCIWIVSSTIKIIGCEITGATLAVVEAKGEGTYIHLIGNTISGNQQSGVYIHSNAEGLIEENILADNGYHGIQVRYNSKLTARANTIVHNTHIGILVKEESHAELNHNIIAYHNSKNFSKGIRSTGKPGQSPAAKITLNHNCLWNNKEDYVGEMNYSTDFQTDPCFVDPENGDYRLLPHSPCIGTGMNGENLGALPVVPQEPKPSKLTTDMFALQNHLKTLPFSHIVSQDDYPGRSAAWLSGAAAANIDLPFFMARDLGLLMIQPMLKQNIQKPIFLPFDMLTDHYIQFLERLSHHPLMRDISKWQPPVSDTIIAVIIARLTQGVEFSKTYHIPTGPAGKMFIKALANELEQANPEEIWHHTPTQDRPDATELFSTKNLTQIEKNLHTINRDEIRFLARYGAPILGSPDPKDLLDLLALTNLPTTARLAQSQTLKLLPQISSEQLVKGGIQTYPQGGYEGLSHKGSLDNLLRTELAFPEEIFCHRFFNNESLYYGRERQRDQRKELAYIVAQLGWGLGEDGQVISRAMVLALSKAMQQRGYDVYFSFAAETLTEPTSLNTLSQTGKVLYQREKGLAKAEVILPQVAQNLRTFHKTYPATCVLWILSEYFDADFYDDHPNLYQDISRISDQQAWFIHPGKNRHCKPPAAVYFKRWQSMNTCDVLGRE